MESGADFTYPRSAAPIFKRSSFSCGYDCNNWPTVWSTSFSLLNFSEPMFFRDFILIVSCWEAIWLRTALFIIIGSRTHQRVPNKSKGGGWRTRSKKIDKIMRQYLNLYTSIRNSGVPRSKVVAHNHHITCDNTWSKYIDAVSGLYKSVRIITCWHRFGTDCYLQIWHRLAHYHWTNCNTCRLKTTCTSFTS